MNNYQNPNGQFGGWGQVNTPNGNNFAYNDIKHEVEDFMRYEEKKNEKKLLCKMGSRFGLAVLAYVFLSVVISLVIGALTKVSPVLNLLYEETNANYAYNIIGSILYIGIPFGLVYFALKGKKLTGLIPFGTAYNGKAAVFLTMLFVPVMIISSMIVNFVSLLIQGMAGIEFTSGLEDLEVVGADGFLISVVAMAIVPAIIEEFAIRGVVLQPLRRYGDTFAIITSALIFSIMHGNMAQIPYTVVGGIYLGYLAVATGSIWPSIIVHFVNNMYSVVIMAVTSTFGENWSYVAAVVMMVLIIISGILGGVGFFSMRYKTRLQKGVKTLNLGEKIVALFLNIPMILAIIIMVIITLTSVKA